MKQFRIALIVWAGFLCVVCLIILSKLGIHTNTPYYMLGAYRWMHSLDLYTHTGQGFIYLPPAAIFFIPLTYLSSFSFPIEEIVWRILSGIFFIYGLYRFVKYVDMQNAPKIFLIATIVSIPITFSVIRNGQFSVIIMALTMLALVNIAEEKWWWATALLVIGLALKPTMIVVLLLVWILYRPLWWRIPVGLLGIFFAPFLFQNPHYVMQQYLNSLTMLNEVANVGSVETTWAQIFGLLAQIKIVFARHVQDIIRFGFAVVTLFACYIAKKKYSQPYTILFIYTLATIYLMLFNPRTENTDYGMLAPAIGILLSMFWLQKRKIEFVVLVLIAIGISGCYYFSHLITPDSGNWFAPLMTILFAVVVARIYMISITIMR